MLIDNSQLKAWQTCKYLWYEKYFKGVELDWAKKAPGASEYGKRMHELLEEHYRDLQGSPIPPYEAYPNEPVELEAQLTMASYRNNYPVEPFTVVDVEKTFRVPLGGPRCPQHYVELDAENRCPEDGYVMNPLQHEYTGKMDVVIRSNDGALGIVDHKNEKRTAHSNNPKAWAARTQATLYIWAAGEIYGEKVDGLTVNVLRRQSDKGQVGCEFRRDDVERNPEQIESAVRGLIMVADEITAAINWPLERWQDSANRNNCMQGNFECDYYGPHIMGWSDDLLRLYRPTEPYLDL
jgi:PD-(D/E)XK nuclease superfamily